MSSLNHRLRRDLRLGAYPPGASFAPSTVTVETASNLHSYRGLPAGRALVERLEIASRRLAQVAGSIGPGSGRQPAPDGGWTARETLAHIVLVSQVLGWATWAVASGEQDEITIMSFLALRDVAGEHFAK